jgi:hypothetical protein
MRYALIAFLGIWMFAVSAAASTSPRLNIVYILADDLGYGDLSCYGQKKFETPNLDRRELASVKPPATDGISLVPILTGRSAEQRRKLVSVGVGNFEMIWIGAPAAFRLKPGG